MSKKPAKSKKNRVKKADWNSAVPMPTKEQILEFIQSSSEKVGKREIARAFHLRGSDKIPLKRMLKEMSEEGAISHPRKKIKRPGDLPPVAVIDIVGTDDMGDFYGLPSNWKDSDGPKPRVLINEKSLLKLKGGIPGVGDSVLARIDTLKLSDDNKYPFSAQAMKRIGQERETMLGIFHKTDIKGGIISPVEKKAMKEWPIPPQHCKDIPDGELVRFELKKHGKYGERTARILERLGHPADQKQISLIAIHNHGIPNEFPKEVLTELDSLTPPTLEGRVDLRDIPLLTIDPADARDHDDAIWASYDDDPQNEGGFITIVAIADVAHYIERGSELDREALKRGNSVYFPDRVVPMLPERISNDLCSLRELEDRPCLAVKMVYNKKGVKLKHTFIRGLMRSAAKLSYQQAQAAIDGTTDEKTAPLLEDVLKPLWAAFHALQIASKKRAPLALDLPERKIVMDDMGLIQDIITPERLDAHKLVEEFMIQANVCAAESLESKRKPLIYRIHETPPQDKAAPLAQFLSTLNISFTPQGQLKPEQFNKILKQVEGTEFTELVNTVVLRSQTQAVYSPHNMRHFGLNLDKYAHFTSPIRRYADLTVHRALVHAFNLGKGGYSPQSPTDYEQVAQDISDLERRAMRAERETTDRLIANYLSDKVGVLFRGRISGVNKVGLFIQLDNTGADGFIPARTLGADYFLFDEDGHAMRGERTGETFRLGDKVEVKLIEVVPTAGAMRFEMITEGTMEQPPKRRGRGGGGRHRYDRGGRSDNRGRGGRNSISRNPRRDDDSSRRNSAQKSRSYGTAASSEAANASESKPMRSTASKPTSASPKKRSGKKKIGGFVGRPSDKA